MLLGYSALSDLARLRRGVRRERLSSWDRTGGNDDFITLRPGESRTIADIPGAGCIRHLWMTMESHEPAWPRQIALRMWWDGETSPSVEAPIGDFYGIVKNFSSLPLQMSPEDGRAFNCWFPMPFAGQARLEVTNETQADYILYFYIDYERYAPAAAAELAADYGRFHCQWRRQNPTDGWADLSRMGDNAFLAEAWRTPNLDGRGNYIVLDAAGKGHYVGCHLDIDNYQRQLCPWYGEGDDMISITSSTSTIPPLPIGIRRSPMRRSPPFCPSSPACPGRSSLRSNTVQIGRGQSFIARHRETQRAAEWRRTAERWQRSSPQRGLCGPLLLSVLCVPQCPAI